MATFSAKIFYGSLALAGLVLGLHCLILWISPFESVYPTAPAIAILWAFIAIFFVCGRLVFAGRGIASKDRPATSITLDGVFQDHRLQIFLVLVSLAGVILHIWAKLYLTELRPISCLSEIRFAWMEVERQALPLHIKAASVLGHLLTSFTYFGIMIASFNIGRFRSVGLIRRSDQILQIFFVTVGVLYAGFIGSRNAMLAFFAMGLVGVTLVAAVAGQARANIRQWRVFLAGLLLPLITSVLFSSLIFSDRLFCYTPDALSKSNGEHVSASGEHVSASGEQISARKITEHHMTGYYKEFALIPRFGDGRSYAGQPDWRWVLFIDKCSICGATMLYLNHGIFNLSKMMASEARGDRILLKFFSSLPERLGLAEAPTTVQPRERVYGPGGITLAGAAYHDFGVTGLVTTAAVLGALFGGSIRMIQASGVGALVGVWMFSWLLYLLLISNMFVGFSVLPFPFIVFGVGGGLIAWLVINHLRPVRDDETPLRTHSTENRNYV